MTRLHMSISLPQLQAALVGRYTLLHEIGQGGMATVFLAEDLRHHRRVAIKVLQPEFAAITGPERFLREIAIAAGLGHPNILPLLDSGDAGGFLFYAMPYAEGESLRNRLDRDHQLPLDDALCITREIGAALSHAHARGVTHRDIKPENILLFGGQAVLTDFGIARAVTASGEKALTSTGMIIGTPTYMSPEQATGDAAVGPQSDQYSVACVLYEMLAGHPPFVGPTPQAITARKLSDPVPRLTTVRESVSPALERSITRALAKSPADRFPTVDAFLASLAAGGTEIPAKRPRARLNRRKLGAVLVILALMAVVGGVWVLAKSRASPPRFARVAILPLRNLPTDSVPSYVLEGMTAGLISELARLERVEIMAPASVETYRGGSRPHEVVGRELNVGAIVEGELGGSDRGLRLALRLFRPDSLAPLWTGTLEGSAGAIDSLQREAAATVARQLGAELPRRNPRRPASREVEDLYLRGRYHLSTRTPEGLQNALDYFRQALAAAPAHAPSYAGLAEYYSVLPFYTSAIPAEEFSKAKAAAQRAVELDPMLPDGHRVLGYVKAFGDWDWAGAEAAYARALALKPSDADLHHAVSRILAARGRIPEAVAEAQKAHQLDPLSLVAHANIGVIYYFGRNYSEAERRMRATLELNPDFPVAHWGLGLVYEQMGRLADAEAEILKAIAVAGRGRNWLGSLGHLYGIAGRRAEAEAILRELQQRSRGPTGDYQMALVWAGLGRGDEALTALERALEERSTLMSYLAMDPRFDPLRSSPRFIALVRQMGFERRG
ncbi:MAG: protein kinase domain-containing protein [Gemmatimonadales bacterium]